MINSEGVKQIWVATGTYKPGSYRTSSFLMKDDLTIYGGFPASSSVNTNPEFSDRDPNRYPTILSGDIDGDGTLTGNCYHVVTNLTPGGSFMLDGLVITGGNANSDLYYRDQIGGGMLNVSSGVN